MHSAWRVRSNGLTIYGQWGEGVRLTVLLLLIPYIAMLWVASYNRAEPAFAGIPFFYWYQLLWIPLGSLLLLLVWWTGRRRREKGAP